METRDTGTQHKLRMPPELKERLFASAKEMNRSLNAEIVARLEKSFEKQDGVFVTKDEFSAIRLEYSSLLERMEDLIKTLNNTKKPTN